MKESLSEAMNDKEKRDAAVDAFAKAMKQRLDEKAAEGYIGWDGSYPDYDLLHEIYDDASSILLERNGWSRKKGIDIANRVMMLWLWHREHTAPGGGEEEKKP